MSDVDDFLSAIIPRQRAADTALHNGDPGPRLAMWSRNDTVTLFGAWYSARGREDVSAIFERLAAAFQDCESFDLDVVAAAASGDLGYLVAYEHTTATVKGVRQTYTLRVTHVYRREDGEWKIVHRHGDSVPDEPLHA